MTEHKDKPQGTFSRVISKKKSDFRLRLQKVPIVPGPLFRLEEIREALLDRVAEKTRDGFSEFDLETLLGEALYAERLRLKAQKTNLFTSFRYKKDQKLWNQVHQGLLRPGGEVDLQDLLKSVIQHFAEEIGGHFHPKVYEFATHAVPWGFSWLLNAASVKRFLPWGMTESLQSRLHILGEVSTLQKLSKKGTILLVPTHQSNIDSVLVGYVIYLLSLPPFSYGAGLNLFSNPVLSFLMSRLGSYRVDRQKNNDIYRATLKNYSTQILREGMHSIFFPGGGRSRSGAIESRVKLGLLGTALEAQIEGIRTQQPCPNVYIIPMVTSYHFVLEASSLIESHLSDVGKHKYIGIRDESWQITQIFGFFWKLFSSQSGILIRIGKPMDVFGNPVDEEGRSMGPNDTVIDVSRWLTTRGKLTHEPQRDREYTRELGVRLVDRFHRENTVITSHWVAFVLFEVLRKKYPDFDLFRFLRLSLPQRSLPLSDFLIAAERSHQKLIQLASEGRLFLSEELSFSTEKWVRDGVKQLGLLHDIAVVKISEDAIWTEDMNLLYYYRNRLSGYGLSLDEGKRNLMMMGQYDSQGFLA